MRAKAAKLNLKESNGEKLRSGQQWSAVAGRACHLHQLHLLVSANVTTGVCEVGLVSAAGSSPIVPEVAPLGRFVALDGADADRRCARVDVDASSLHHRAARTISGFHTWAMEETSRKVLGHLFEAVKGRT